MQRVERFIEIDAPVERVFDLLCDFESYPRWMRRLREVRRTGPRRTHWVCETALEMDVEWDAETTVFEPDHRLVWRSVRGDIHADGETIIEETPRGTALVHVVLGYDTPAGRTGRALARFFGTSPARQLEEDLARLRLLAERRPRRAREDEDARARYAPFTREHLGEHRREWWGEPARPPRELRREERRHGPPEREMRRPLPRQEERRREDEERRREAEARRRDEERRRGADERRREEAERRRFEERPARPPGERAEEEEYRPRFALTWRERERERRAEREQEERRETERLRRRGIDRLLDDEGDEDRRRRR